MLPEGLVLSCRLEHGCSIWLLRRPWPDAPAGKGGELRPRRVLGRAKQRAWNGAAPMCPSRRCLSSAATRLPAPALVEWVSDVAAHATWRARPRLRWGTWCAYGCAWVSWVDLLSWVAQAGGKGWEHGADRRHCPSAAKGGRADPRGRPHRLAERRRVWMARMEAEGCRLPLGFVYTSIVGTDFLLGRAYSRPPCCPPPAPTTPPAPLRPSVRYLRAYPAPAVYPPPCWRDVGAGCYVMPSPRPVSPCVCLCASQRLGPCPFC